MVHECKNICRTDYETTGNGEFPYERGYKFCKNCSTNIKYEGIWCPCCNYRLRLKNRHNKKNKWTYESYYFQKSIEWACEYRLHGNRMLIICKK